jgi:hypothetical protein
MSERMLARIWRPFVLFACLCICNASHGQMLQSTSIPSTLSDNRDEFLKRVMHEFYGEYDKALDCWTSKYGDAKYCMKPVKLDILNSKTTKRFYIAVSGNTLSNDGEIEDCHACGNFLGLIALVENGEKFGVLAKSDLYAQESNSASALAREAISVRAIGPNDAYGWIITVRDSGTGETIGFFEVHAIVGDSVVLLTKIPEHYDNLASGCESEKRPHCTELSAELLIDSTVSSARYFPILSRFSGLKRGRSFSDTYRFTFDAASLKYLVPKNLPQELMPY